MFKESWPRRYIVRVVFDDFDPPLVNATQSA